MMLLGHMMYMMYNTWAHDVLEGVLGFMIQYIYICVYICNIYISVISNYGAAPTGNVPEFLDFHP